MKIKRQERLWIGEIRCRALKTVLVRAANRKEAERKLRALPRQDVEGVDVDYTEIGPGRIIREDKTS